MSTTAHIPRPRTEAAAGDDPADRAGAATTGGQSPARAAWQHDLARAFRHGEDLLRYLGLARHPELSDAAAAAAFPLLVPRAFAALMRHGDPGDPLLRQVLPTRAEHLQLPGFVDDPVDDAGASCTPGLLQKYAGRALLLATGACAVHCRYCFRRHYPYAELGPRRRLDAALAEIADRPDLHELILSGGDPLMLDDTKLARLLGRLRSIPHLRRIRLHTRLPIVLPSRVTPALCALLAQPGARAVMVVHANHPAELGDDAARALALLHAAGVPLLNQSVLLAGVNDDLHALAALAERLFELNVQNYYLHQLDPVRGATGFAVDDDRARALVEHLRALLPGFLVPRLVREVPGAASKTPLG